MTATPQLYAFGISHYCEKARWALDWRGIAFKEVRWPPGPHILLARRQGAAGSSLPILRHADEVIQGSGAIIDWAERMGGGPSLTPELDAERALAIEARADAVLGVHVRRFVYGATLTDHPELVKPLLFDGVAPRLRTAAEAMWPMVRKTMIAGMDAGPEAAPDSQVRIEDELDWLEERLAEGGGFLAGGGFSRADLTVASLLAPLARPDEAPIYRDFSLPQPLAATVEAWRRRPLLQWVLTIYREHRRPVRPE